MLFIARLITWGWSALPSEQITAFESQLNRSAIKPPLRSNTHASSEYAHSLLVRRYELLQ